jgi:prepilin-type N-terminal cleavage/methylation domain-containing protein
MTGLKSAPRPRAFTLTEVMVVSVLMSFLVVLLASAWAGFGRPMAEVVARCRLAQEANLAAESLATDLAGSLADQAVGTRRAAREVGRMIVDESELRLCFDGQPVNGEADWAAPDTVVVYEVQSGNLVRSDELAGTAIVVAGNVDQLQLAQEADGLHVELTFVYRGISRTFTIIAKET